MLHDYVAICQELVLKRVDRDKYAVFLFGSRARNTHFPKSDIDVGLWGREKVDALTMLDLQDVFDESIIPYKVDLVDFSYTDESFRRVALKNIVVWNNPPAFHWPYQNSSAP